MRTLLLLLASLLALAAGRAGAQVTPPAPVPVNGVYPYAEHMPTLTSILGEYDVRDAAQDAFNRLTAGYDGMQGTIYVGFIVTEAGRAVQPYIVRGLNATLDTAALAAVRQLPTLKPARQGGQPVRVRAVTSVTAPDHRTPSDYLAGQGNPPGWNEPIEDKVYEFAEVMPTLPSWGGSGAVIDALQRGTVLTQPTRGLVVVRFVVDRQGVAGNAAITRSLSSSADAAVLAAVQRLPRFSPGSLRGQRARVQLTVPVWLEYGPATPTARPAAPGKGVRPRR